MIYFIAAISENNVIGIHNKLPWHIPNDLKWFQMNTKMGAVIMGRKTWDSLPIKPLPNRLNIIISKTPRKSHPNVIWTRSVEHALFIARNNSMRIYIIGGANIWGQIFPYIDIYIITKVHCNIEHKDRIKIDIPCQKKLVWRSKRFQHKKLSYNFEIYIKILN
jgi:dihydrofolate reductase